MDQSVSAPRNAARMGRVPWRAVTFALLLAAYIVLTLGVIYRSPMLTLDQDVLGLELRWRYPQVAHWIVSYVMLGQRAPATLVALPWFVWRCWMSRSPRPLIMLCTALLVLNVTVGVVKVATGRLGPLATHQVHAVFAGGNIFPSGHVSNAVVLYGVMAMLAVNYRRFALAACGRHSADRRPGHRLPRHPLVLRRAGGLAGRRRWCWSCCRGSCRTARPASLRSVERCTGPGGRWNAIRPAGRCPHRWRTGLPSHVGSWPSGCTAFDPRTCPRTLPHTRRAHSGHPGVRADRAQHYGKLTPVSASAFDHSLAATAESCAALFGLTRIGWPRISPNPAGP